MRQREALLAAVVMSSVLAAGPGLVKACDFHWMTGLPESNTTPDATATSAAQAAKDAERAMMEADARNSLAAAQAAFGTRAGKGSGLAVTLAAPSVMVSASVSAATSASAPTVSAAIVSAPTLSAPATGNLNAIAAWKINWTNATGHSQNTTINSFVTSTPTDVTGVWFDATYVYIKTNDVPSYDVGRADGNNPAYPRATNQTLRIVRNPTQNTGTLTSPGNGEVAVAVNGAAIFDAGDAQTYNQAGTWHRIALQFEGATFDSGPGHSAPQGMAAPSNSTPGTYHYHVGPTGLLDQIDISNNGTRHSPIIGFSPDGYPIYGPYGYSDPTNPNSPIKRITTSYQVRSDLQATGAQRNTINGVTLTGSAIGPVVGGQYPAGSFKEDYQYVANSGDLNSFNMRFAVTPEYPNGTWAYYMTTDSAGNFTYPYLLAPNYFGVVPTNALSNITIPANATRLLAGDTNLDGIVDYTDLLNFARNYRRTGVTLWTQGDFDSNTAIDDNDLNLLRGNYNSPATFSADLATALASVPEPSQTWFFLVLPYFALLKRRA